MRVYRVHASHSNTTFLVASVYAHTLMPRSKPRAYEPIVSVNVLAVHFGHRTQSTTPTGPTPVYQTFHPGPYTALVALKAQQQQGLLRCTKLSVLKAQQQQGLLGCTKLSILVRKQCLSQSQHSPHNTAPRSTEWAGVPMCLEVRVGRHFAIFTACSLNIHCMFFESDMNVPSMFAERSLHKTSYFRMTPSWDGGLMN
jgi:hypothetical protein